MKMFYALVMLVSLFFMPGLAAADPETAYQGGEGALEHACR